MVTRSCIPQIQRSDQWYETKSMTRSLGRERSLSLATAPILRYPFDMTHSIANSTVRPLTHCELSRLSSSLEQLSGQIYRRLYNICYTDTVHQRKRAHCLAIPLCFRLPRGLTATANTTLLLYTSTKGTNFGQRRDVARSTSTDNSNDSLPSTGPTFYQTTSQQTTSQTCL